MRAPTSRKWTRTSRTLRRCGMVSTTGIVNVAIFHFSFIPIDPKECFEYLYNTVKDSPTENSFLSILQHLLFIRDDTNVRYAYFRMIEECIAKIVLYREGRDPDFECGS